VCYEVQIKSNIIVLISGFIIGSLALKQENLHQYIQKISNNNSIKVNNKLNSANIKPIKIENEKNDEILESLKKLMETKKPYLNSKLTIDDLAIILNINKRILSGAINTKMGTNVYGFINDYRICEFKKLAQNPKMDYLSIEGMAQKVGFRSKSSFNASFKKATGQTPSQFRIAIKGLE
jgi:AraC-like DNA-binding protein